VEQRAESKDLLLKEKAVQTFIYTAFVFLEI
jgi:hypothetical protein